MWVLVAHVSPSVTADVVARPTRSSRLVKDPELLRRGRTACACTQMNASASASEPYKRTTALRIDEPRPHRPSCLSWACPRPRRVPRRLSYAYSQSHPPSLHCSYSIARHGTADPPHSSHDHGRRLSYMWTTRPDVPRAELAMCPSCVFIYTALTCKLPYWHEKIARDGGPRSSNRAHIGRTGLGKKEGGQQIALLETRHEGPSSSSRGAIIEPARADERMEMKMQDSPFIRMRSMRRDMHQ